MKTFRSYHFCSFVLATCVLILSPFDNASGAVYKCRQPKCVAVVSSAELPRDSVWDALGLKYRPIPEAKYKETYAEYLNDYPQGGIVVTAVRRGSPLKGVLPGDVIVGIHHWSVTSTNDARYVAKAWPNLNPPNGVIRVNLLRNGKAYFTDVPAKK